MPTLSWLDQVVYFQEPPAITSELTALGTQGTPFNYTINIAVNNADSFDASGLPDGLTIDTATGIISGTPAVDGVFNIGLSATNGGGTDNRILVLTLFTEDQVENTNDSGPGSMRQLIINADPGDILTYR